MSPGKSRKSAVRPAVIFSSTRGDFVTPCSGSSIAITRALFPSAKIRQFSASGAKIFTAHICFSPLALIPLFSLARARSHWESMNTIIDDFHRHRCGGVHFGNSAYICGSRTRSWRGIDYSFIRVIVHVPIIRRLLTLISTVFGKSFLARKEAKFFSRLRDVGFFESFFEGVGGGLFYELYILFLKKLWCEGFF